jgi:hypothetical protein
MSLIGKRPRSGKKLYRGKLSGVLVGRVTFQKGIASWTFTTESC